MGKQTAGPRGAPLLQHYLGHNTEVLKDGCCNAQRRQLRILNLRLGNGPHRIAKPSIAAVSIVIRWRRMRQSP
jgi:hypothetical protein